MVLKEVDSTTSVGNLCQSSVTLTIKCFLMFKQNLLFFSSCPLLLVLSLSTTKESLAPPSLPHFIIYLFIYIDKISPQSFLICLMFPSLHHLHSPSLDSPVDQCLSCTGEPRTGHSTPGVALLVLCRGQGSPTLTCWK